MTVFANDYICDDNLKDRVLYANEALKFMYKSQDAEQSAVSLKSGVYAQNSYGGYLLNDCGHRCGEERLDNMGWQEWTLFAMNPALFAAGLFAVCISLCY